MNDFTEMPKFQVTTITGFTLENHTQIAAMSAELPILENPIHQCPYT